MIFDPPVARNTPVSHKTGRDIVPSEATTCDERSRRMRSENAASRYIRHSRRSVKLAPPATLSESGFPLPNGDSDSSHRRQVFNAFIIRGLMTPKSNPSSSSEIYYESDNLVRERNSRLRYSLTLCLFLHLFIISRKKYAIFLFFFFLLFEYIRDRLNNLRFENKIFPAAFIT